MTTNILSSPFQQFITFRDEVKLKCEVYEKFRRKAESKTFLIVTEDKWMYVTQRWRYVTAQMRVWQWKLDSNLPGKLGPIGDWLYRAEERLDTEIKYPEDPEETAKLAHERLEEHKVRFGL